ncbi:hypothetical protein [Actinacidiphila sp. ITFR-21]|uniref:hypothetical protein n=1 Tax=Actinacidiphila sp. ITFR-21 TaxID=3075199 RepID=UPI00288B7793|nr:hypothetical protein [Streptomyces sp. ITFR-21]WNI16817.1 hypothetical protein RLT57_15695 [Streptomyces sp. ITFR-21]
MQTPLLSVRAALVLTLSLLTGVGAGVLSAVGGVPSARCVLCGAGAFGLAVPFFDRLIGATGPE